MRKKHIFTTLAILAFSLSMSCQKQHPVSREGGYIPNDDSIYIQAVQGLYTDPVGIRSLLQTTLKTRQVEDSTNWYILYNLYIKTFLVTSELDTIIPLCRKVEDYCARQPEKTPQLYYLLTDITNNIGNLYAYTSANDSSLKYFKKTLDYSRHTEIPRTLTTAYINIADAYVRSGRFDQGAWNYRQALYLADSLSLPAQDKINIYTGLGQTYMELRNFELSHHYYNLALANLDKMDLQQIFISYVNHGNTYYFEQKYPEALALFKKAYERLAAHPEYNYPLNICMLNIGEIYMLMGQLDSATYYLDRSNAFFESIGNMAVIYHAQTQLFELALKKGDLAEATRIRNRMTDDPNAEPTLVGIRRKYLQHYFEETGNFQKAYQYLAENTKMDDSIRSERIRMNAAETDLRFKQDTTLIKQELFIREQQSEIESIQLNVFIWIFASALLLIVAIFIYFYHTKQQALLRAETRNKIISLRMENIRNRVSPHFIFNTLNRVISHYEPDDESYKELLNLTQIMRLNLRLTEKLCITLEEEIDFVRTYLALEAGRFDTPLQTAIDIAPDLDPQQIQLPSMMIQIPVENALKHGLRNKEGEKRLTVSVAKSGENILISIEDNGSGFHLQAGKADPQSTGTGLKVLNQTVQLLNAGNKNPITIEIRKSNSGSEEYPGCLVQFILPEHYSYIL